ncbi:MAG TPA: PAS domain-containing protein [Salinarimonas sp.]|nr:PAS domain-containing protein [Salinarimonas sp.]
MAGHNGHSYVDLLGANGETGRLLAALDWSGISIGPPETWPQSLKTAVDIMLASPRPVSVIWGPDRIQLYNDSYVPIAGDRHPRALGRSAAENWADAYEGFLGPVLDRAYGGEAVVVEDHQVLLRRPSSDLLEERSFSATFKPIRDETGRVAGVFHPLNETTAQRRAEAERAASEERLQMAIEGADLGTWDLDLVNDVATRSLRHDQMFGYAELQPTWGLAVAERHILPEDLPVLRTAFERAYDTGELVLEARVRWPDGSTHWIAARGRVHRDETGRPVRMAGVVQDVTARKVAEEEVRKSQAELKAIFDQATVGIAETDLTGRFIRVNDRYCEIVGRTRHELLGLRMHDITHPADLGGNVPQFMDTASGGRPFEIVKRYVRPDGGTIWVHNNVAPVRSSDGQVTGILAVTVDLTAQRAAEEALRRSEARFRGIFDSDLMGFTVFDVRSGRTLLINDCFLAMTGHTRADFDEGRWDWREFTLPEYLHLDEAAIEQARGRGWWDPYEKEYRRRDGGRFPVRISSAPLPGEPGLVVVSVQDVSTTWAAQAELRRSERRLRLAKQAAGVGVWDWDLVTNLIDWSPEMFDLLGVDPNTPPDGLYAAWADALHPDDRAKAEPVVQATARDGGGFSFDFRRTSRDGEIRWIRSQAVAVAGADGRPIRLTGVNLDVTAERREEERLRETAQTLASMVEERTRERDRMFDLSNDLFASAGFDGYLKAINPAWERLLGYSETELLTMPFAALIHPDDAAAAAKVIAGLARGEPLARFEDRLVAKDGRVVWIAWAAVAEGDRFYASGRDVTAERAAAAELEAAQEALRQSQKMEAMGQLTGGVAHDFNNLLTPIVGGLDMLQRKRVGGEREQRLIAGAMQSAERAKTLVQRLLAFARRQPLQPVPVDVGKLVTGMAELVASTTGPQIRVVVEAPDHLPPALADPNQLEMALLNLSVNARDAMPDGGTLRISAGAETVRAGHPSGLKPGTYVKLSVADTGSGMDEATLKRAVEPFFSTKGIGKGTGLGLSMVHGLALQLGGALTIRSRPGLGTNVELFLPRSADAPQQTEAAAPAAPAAALRGTALLVDDEEIVRTSTAEMLGDLGYSVVQAASAEEAMRLLGQGARFDLLVTDHLMPGMSGTDLARAARAALPGTPVLVISGYAEMEGVLADVPRLTKPFRQDELAACIAQLVNGG